MKLPTKASRIAMEPKDNIMLFYGPPGVGKTTFVNDIAGGNVLFISTDRGTRHLKTMRVECFKWEKVLETLSELEKSGAPHYDMICFDHVDDVANMAESYVLKKYDVDSLTDPKLPYGKGWKEFKTQINGAMLRIMKLGTGVAFIAHEDMKTIKIRGLEKTMMMPSMGKTAWKIIIPLADIVGYCFVRSVKKEGGKRQEVHSLQTQPTETIYAKDRTSRSRPDDGMEELSGKKFIASFQKGASNGEEDNEEQTARSGRRRRRGN